MVKTVEVRKDTQSGLRDIRKMSRVGWFFRDGIALAALVRISFMTMTVYSIIFNFREEKGRRCQKQDDEDNAFVLLLVLLLSET
jgi:hypothetical protein